MQDRLTHYAQTLKLDLSAIQLIQRNKYCAIGRGILRDGHHCIIKDYGDSDPELARLEAEALDFYDDICRNTTGLKPCRLLAYNPQQNILAMSFMDGSSYTRLVYRALVIPHKRPQALAHAHALGTLLRELYQRRHHPDIPMGDFMREYLDYVSNRLARVPLLGPALLGKTLPSTETLFHAAQDCGEPTSFCHGDCVPRNAHADDHAVGLVDWANTRHDSHILNDCYNFLIAAHNMFLAPRYRHQLMQALSDGLGPLCFDVRLHRFFYEYHRRRWLMLKLYARNPGAWLQAMRGMLTFARPFSPARLGVMRNHVKGQI